MFPADRGTNYNFLGGITDVISVLLPKAKPGKEPIPSVTLKDGFVFFPNIKLEKMDSVESYAQNIYGLIESMKGVLVFQEGRQTDDNDIEHVEITLAFTFPKFQNQGNLYLMSAAFGQEIIRPHIQQRRIVHLYAQDANTVGGIRVDRLYEKIGMQYLNYDKDDPLPEAILDIKTMAEYNRYAENLIKKLKLADSDDVRLNGSLVLTNSFDLQQKLLKAYPIL